MSDAPKEEEHQLGALASELAAALEMDGVELVVPEPVMKNLSKRCETTPPEERRAICLDLLALASRLEREGGASTRPAIGQLADLVAILLVSGEAARALFEAAGLEGAARAATVTGAQASNRPVGGEKVEGATSPLGARFSKIPGED